VVEWAAAGVPLGYVMGPFGTEMSALLGVFAKTREDVLRLIDSQEVRDRDTTYGRHW